MPEVKLRAECSACISEISEISLLEAVRLLKVAPFPICPLGELV